MAYSMRPKYRKISARVRGHLDDIAENQEQSLHASELPQDPIEQDVCELGYNNNAVIVDTNNVSEQMVDDVEDELYFSDSAQSSVLCDDDTDNNSYNTRESLAEWSLQFRVPHACLSGFLKILIKANLDVPADPRTLASAP